MASHPTASQTNTDIATSLRRVESRRIPHTRSPTGSIQPEAPSLPLSWGPSALLTTKRTPRVENARRSCAGLRLQRARDLIQRHDAAQPAVAVDRHQGAE